MNNISSLFGFTDLPAPLIRRVRTCAICNTEGHNAMSCDDQCIIERTRMIQSVLLSNSSVSYDEIQSVWCKIRTCNHPPTFWRRVWLKLRELITSPADDIGIINRDYLEYLLREPSELIIEENYKNRLYEIIVRMRRDIVIMQNRYVPIVEHIERSLSILEPESIQEPIVYNEQPKQIRFKMDSNPSNYYEQLNCPVCFDHITVDKRIAFNCAHVFCAECAPKIIKTKKCPTCRETIEQIRFTAEIRPEVFNVLSDL